MKITLYYFTGTGNCLQVAKELSANLGDCCTQRIFADTLPETDADVIGFIFPVYLWGMPLIVERFLEQLPVAMEDKYLFAVATYMCQPGAVMRHVVRTLKRTYNKLSAGFVVEMPGNNIIYYEVEPEAEQSRKTQACRKRAEEIAAIVNQKETYISHNSPIQTLLFTGFLHGMLSSQFEKSDRNFRANDNCTHCSICEKICPMGNIILVNGYPNWQHHCQQCTACLNACPSAAIQYGKTTVGKRRYINKTCGISSLLETHRSE